jgi:putative flippase GtrA
VNYLIANCIAIALCSLMNFLVSEKWIFVGEAENEQETLAVSRE